MEFEKGERVKLKATGRAGIVEDYSRSSDLYYVRFNNYTTKWCEEKDLTWEHLYIFDDKFEHGLLSLMIDINLDEGNLKMVKNYADLKRKLG